MTMRIKRSRSQLVGVFPHPAGVAPLLGLGCICAKLLDVQEDLEKVMTMSDKKYISREAFSSASRQMLESNDP